MIKAHKIRLNVRRAPHGNYFARAAGTARFTYNWLRHEVACVAVETAKPGLNLVFSHQYSTETCVGSNLGWEALRTM